MSLYLKYRPKNIEELDLDEVRETLGRLVKSGKLGHAYLFTGPRGAGKTSSARILAKVVNCEVNKDKPAEPCGKCSACTTIATGAAVDLVEIDAASNRGIDDIRELKARIGLAPTSFRKKIYIIDEVHMLTNEAFNALLKILEEPPGHSMFILCTTEVHKIPETIASRCVRVNFSKATVAEMMRSLKRVVKGEGIKIETEALEYLAGEVDGSFRDGVKMLEQLSSLGKEITRADVEGVLYGSSGFNPKEFLTAMVTKQASKALEALWEVEKAGVDMSYFLKVSMLMLRDALLAKYGVGKNPLDVVVGNEAIRLVQLMDTAARNLAGSVAPMMVVELMVLEWCDSGQSDGGGQNPPSGGSGSKRETEEVITKKANGNGHGEVKELATNGNGHSEIHKSETVVSVDERGMKDMWQALMQNMNGSNYSLEALLSKARPRAVDGVELTIEVLYKFHKEQLEAEKYRVLIEEMVSKVFGAPMRVKFELGGKRKSDVRLRESGMHDSMAKEIGSVEEEDLVQVAKEIFT